MSCDGRTAKALADRLGTGCDTASRANGTLFERRARLANSTADHEQTILAGTICLFRAHLL